MQIRFLVGLLAVGIFVGLVGCAQNSGSSAPGSGDPGTPPTKEQDNGQKPPTIENPSNQLWGTWINDSNSKFAKYKITFGPKYSWFSTICLYDNGAIELEADVKTQTKISAEQIDVVRSANRIVYKDKMKCITQVNVNSYLYRVSGSHLEMQAIFEDRTDVFSSQNYRKIE